MSEFKLFKCVYKTAEGVQTGYMIDTDVTAASLGLILVGRIKHTDIHIEVTEVPMDKRMFLGALKEKIETEYLEDTKPFWEEDHDSDKR